MLDNEILIRAIVELIENEEKLRNMCDDFDEEIYSRLYDRMDLLLDWLDDTNIYETATELCEILDELSPPGVYFGINESNGTIGFYKDGGTAD